MEGTDIRLAGSSLLQLIMGRFSSARGTLSAARPGMVGRFVGSVVGEDASASHYTGADALSPADPKLGGGAPARTDRIVRDKGMLAGRAKICATDADFNESRKGRVHVESVRPG